MNLNKIASAMEALEMVRNREPFWEDQLAPAQALLSRQLASAAVASERCQSSNPFLKAMRCTLNIGHAGSHATREYRWALQPLMCGHADSCIAGEGLTHWCEGCRAGVRPSTEPIYACPTCCDTGAQYDPIRNGLEIDFVQCPACQKGTYE